MKLTSLAFPAKIIAAPALVALLLTSRALAASPDYAYTGQGIALRVDGVVNPPGLNPLIVSDTTPLAIAGGNQQVTTANLDLAGGALTISAAVALTNGAGPKTESHAQVSNFHVEFVTDDGGRCIIEAGHIHAHATATAAAGPNQPSTDVNVVINNFKYNGVTINVTGAPNQVVVIGEARFIFNEQTTSTTATSADADVIAVHFWVCHCIEGRIAVAQAGVTKP